MADIAVIITIGAIWVQSPNHPDEEAARVRALLKCNILDTQPEERFDRLTRLAKHVFGTQMALVSIVDTDRQWFKSRQGLEAAETPRNISFCGHAILGKDIFHIPNAKLDPRFADNPLVVGPPNISFYAGAPIETTEGYQIGTLCIIDDQPRQLNEKELSILRDLADCVADEINKNILVSQEKILKQTEKRLANAYELLERSNEAARIGTWEIDIEKMQPHWSKVTKIIHEVSADFQCPLEDTINFYKEGENREKITQRFHAALQTGKPYDDELIIITAKGNERWVRAIGIPEFKEGKCQRIYGLFQDISERKQAEKAVEEMNQRFTLAADSAQFGVWEYDLIKNELVWDDWMFRLYGITRSEFSGAYEAWENGLHPDDVERANTEVQRALSGEKNFDTEFRVIYPNNEIHHIKASAIIVRDKQGKAESMIGINYDITDSKKAQIALKENADYTQATIDNMVDSIITISNTGIINSINPATEHIFGYTANEIVGENISLIVPQNENTASQNSENSDIHYIFNLHGETKGQRKNGRLFPVEFTLSKIKHQSASIYVGVIRDITERKRIEQMKTEFVSTVSHELRTPLTSISGSLGLLLGGALGEIPQEAHGMIKIAYKNSQRLTFLINDLLDMEKLEEGKMHFNMRQHGIMALLEQAVQINTALGTARQVSLLIINQIPNIEVNIDSERFMQVISNLLSNAIKYSPESSVVKIFVETKNKTVRITVSDDGPGIPKNFRSQIFQKFAQADSSDTREKGGTGLGLAITRELIVRMGGKIGFDSVEGEGSNFFIDIPIYNSKESDLTAEHSIVTHQNAPRILVVEDDSIIAHTLKKALSQAGYLVDIAYTGAEAIAALKWSQYSAISVDLTLPDISGLDLIKEIRSRPETSGLPIIVLSAKTEEGPLSIECDSTNIEWQSKPVEQTQLLEALDKQIFKSNGRQPRVLHIEDDLDLHQVIKTVAKNNYDFQSATTLEEARNRILNEEFDLIILDLTLPDGSGWDLLADIRTHCPRAKVVILSGQETTPGEARKVETVLLKSKITPNELLDVLHTRIHLPAGINQ